MNISLNDKKIVKVVYKLNENEVIDFNYENGELQSITRSGEDSKVNVPSDAEMVEALKNSGFFDELERARNRDKLAREIADNVITNNDNERDVPTERKYSDESLEKAKKIIELDKEGILDKIVKKNHQKIEDFEKFKERGDEEKNDLDIDACERSIEKLIDKIITSASNVNKDEVNDDFWNYIEEYQNYTKKRDDIISKRNLERFYPISVQERIKNK